MIHLYAISGYVSAYYSMAEVLSWEAIINNWLTNFFFFFLIIDCFQARGKGEYPA